MPIRATYPVSGRVLEALNELARFARANGVRMFLFGSIAETFPRSFRGADLDIGFELDLAQGDKLATERELRRRIESLPTVRPVDLVDFSGASPEFRERALRRTVELPTEP